MPYKKEAISLAELLGVDIFSFAPEGCFVAVVSPLNIKKVLKILKKFNSEAKVIGKVEKGKGVYLQTNLGGFRPFSMPKSLCPRANRFLEFVK